MSTRITKSKTDRVIDGVCGGLAEFSGSILSLSDWPLSHLCSLTGLEYYYILFL
jgi:hypothetical protein